MFLFYVLVFGWEGSQLPNKGLNPHPLHWTTREVSVFIPLIHLECIFICNTVYSLGMLWLVTQSCPTLCDPMDYSPPGSSVHGDYPGKNTGMGCHALLQGIFPIQGLNPGLWHCRWILYHLTHQGSLRILECIAHPFSRGSSQPRYPTGVSSPALQADSLSAELPGKVLC